MMPEPRPPLEYATKADLELLRHELRADIAELRADVSKQISDLKSTIITTLIAQTAIFGTLVTVLKLFA
jgi:hypothetical protein